MFIVKKLLKVDVILSVALTSMFVVMLSGCNYNLAEGFYKINNVEKRVESLTTLSASSEVKSPSVSGSKYSVLIISDTHFGLPDKRSDSDFLFWFENLIQNGAAEEKPQFAICLGDSTQYGKLEDYLEYRQFVDRVEELGRTSPGNANFRVYTIPGNHDFYNGGWEHYRNTVVPKDTFYRFSVNDSSSGFQWYFLDSADGTLGRRQINLLKNAMKADSAPKIVLTHCPIQFNKAFYFVIQNSDERDTLMSLFVRNNVKMVFSGHDHAGGSYSTAGFNEMSIKGYNSFGQCTLVTVDENNKSISIKQVDFTRP